MFEVFTNTSQSLATGQAVTFSNQKFSDSRISLNNSNTIYIATPGRYLIHFDAVGASNTTDTAFTIQMYVNGVAQACAMTTNTIAVAAGEGNLAFDTLIQVNNSCCCVSNAQSIQFVATETESGIISHANAVVIRL